jgi:glutathione peroxidase
MMLSSIALATLLNMNTEPVVAKSVYDFTMKNIEGKPTSLKKYKGKVLLIVNVASKCGLTPQYDGLQKVYAKYKDQGLVVLGFPANNFGGQEPGSDEEIKGFCSTNYNVTFPMFSKVSVKGEDITPLYKWLLDTSGNKADIEWNFGKFIVGRDGTSVSRFSPRLKPDSTEVVAAIESALGKK